MEWNKSPTLYLYIINVCSELRAWLNIFRRGYINKKNIEHSEHWTLTCSWISRIYVNEAYVYISVVVTLKGTFLSYIVRRYKMYFAMCFPIRKKGQPATANPNRHVWKIICLHWNPSTTTKCLSIFLNHSLFFFFFFCNPVRQSFTINSNVVSYGKIKTFVPQVFGSHTLFYSFYIWQQIFPKKIENLAFFRLYEFPLKFKTIETALGNRGKWNSLQVLRKRFIQLNWLVLS